LSLVQFRFQLSVHRNEYILSVRLRATV